MLRTRMRDAFHHTSFRSFAMTGCGWAWAGPKALIKAKQVVPDSRLRARFHHQRAAVAALLGPLDIVKQRCAAFQARRELLVGG